MATKQKSTKRLKREAVVPFVGEENFVVPKKGGFGQPDMEGYVMVAGTITTTNTPTSTTPSTLEGGTTTSTLPIATGTSTPTTTTPPTEVTTQPTVVQAPTTVTGTPQPQEVSDTPQPQTAHAITTTEVVSTLPTFPVWDTLDCTALNSEIIRLQNLMSVSKFAQNVVDAYNSEIAKATAVKTVKCGTATTPVITTIGGGGFGGGGGIGEPPMDEQQQTEEEAKGSSKKTLWVALGILGLLYLLTKKRSS